MAGVEMRAPSGGVIVADESRVRELANAGFVPVEPEARPADEPEAQPADEPRPARKRNKAEEG